MASKVQPAARQRGVDPITFQVIKASLSGIVQEMQNALFRTGFSTIIRESQDASCAIMDINGDVVAQHVVLPRSEEHPSELQSLMRISYAVFCLKTKKRR